MTVFTLEKKDIENLLKDISTLGEQRCCTKRTVIEDLYSLLKSMELTKQERIFAAPRGELIYLTGQNPELR